METEIAAMQKEKDLLQEEIIELENELEVLDRNLENTNDKLKKLTEEDIDQRNRKKQLKLVDKKIKSQNTREKIALAITIISLMLTIFPHRSISLISNQIFAKIPLLIPVVLSSMTAYFTFQKKKWIKMHHTLQREIYDIKRQDIDKKIEREMKQYETIEEKKFEKEQCLYECRTRKIKIERLLHPQNGIKIPFPRNQREKIVEQNTTDQTKMVLIKKA